MTAANREIPAYLNCARKFGGGCSRRGIASMDERADGGAHWMRDADKPKIVKHEGWYSRFVEQTPVIYQGRLTMVISTEDVPALVPRHVHENPRIAVVDFETRKTRATLAQGFSYASAYVAGDVLYVFGANTDAAGLAGDIHVFWSADLVHWQSRKAVEHEEGRKNCKSSVCDGPDGYVMAYASVLQDVGLPEARFAASDDLVHWRALAVPAWRKGRYTGAPVIRHHMGLFYLFYINRSGNRRHFETHLARSRDLVEWEVSPRNPVLTPLPEEGINNSDVDLVEHEGQVKMFYFTGDQRGCGKLKMATFGGALGEFLTGFFD